MNIRQMKRMEEDKRDAGGHLLDDAVGCRDDPFFVHQHSAAPVTNLARLWMCQSDGDLVRMVS